MKRTKESSTDLWIEEDQHDSLKLRYRIKKVLHETQSAHQRIAVVQTHGFGRMLFNDDIAMISERDERVYHEMIGHVPLFVHPGARRVLVVGGGDGGTVREVVRHPSVECCRLVEIDAAVVEACREHIPQTAAALADPRVEVTIEDGLAWVSRTSERYDLVLVDSSDPVGPAVPLFGSEFYTNVHRVLTEDGIVVSQGNSPFYEPEAQRKLLEILRGLFRRVHLYNYSNLIYPGGLWSFSFASNADICPIGDFNPQSVVSSGLDFHYYSPAVHRAAFVLPEFQARNLTDLLTPFKTD